MCRIPDCDGNLYGENCPMRCGHCVRSEQCHQINGTCMNGCDSGYQGSICMEGNFCVAVGSYFKISINICNYLYIYFFYSGCKDNYFGPNCNEMCNSTCKSCNKVTGICDIGCHHGWKGLFCHERMFINVC